MKALLLYTTSGCHLCEEAVSVLNSLDFEWFPVEISTHDSLIERYGLRIPVIRVKGMTEGP
ncbi:MAG: glutaredoxin family protein, partial [Endozoicomonas sp.]